MARTLFDKIWDAHRVKTLPSGEDLIAIDRVFLHERTGSVALESLLESGRDLLDASRVFCTMDHIVSTDEGRGRNDARTPGGDVFITATRTAAGRTGINLIDVDSADQGIVHVISPELGIAQPGLSLVCPDSHTCSQGALGAAAWGIGSTDAEHAMATGTLRLKKPPQMRIRVDGRLSEGITAKDLILHIIGTLGAGGAKRCAVEFYGEAIEALDIEARLTVCNMAVEMAAFTALIAPDAITTAYLKGRRYAPSGPDWDQAVRAWQTLFTDEAASFDHEHIFDARQIGHTVTWGTSPGEAAPLSGQAGQSDYMDLENGIALLGLPIGGAFIGSCTNARISDLRAAATVLKGRKVAQGVTAICVPGSMAVRRQAEDE
ncbi:MAG: aconitase family protein, partial [Pseudomonadota bacterium]